MAWPSNPFPANIKRIAITAPAGGAPRDVVRRACDAIVAFGVETILAPRLFGPSSVKHLSASAADRVADLHDCWRDRGVDAIMAVRGGFGSAHLLPLLDATILRSRNVPLLGFSDLTALHLGMTRLGAGIPIAAPVAANFAEAIEHELTVASLRNALAGGEGRGLTLTLNPVNNGGAASGPVFPLNLTVACSLLGTPYFPDLSGAVLIVEDLNEPVYKLDRCLTQLQLAGVSTSCAGLVFGNFHSCGNEEERRSLFRIVAERFGRPTFSGFPFGHRGPNACLRFGAMVEIDRNGRFRLEPSAAKSL